MSWKNLDLEWIPLAVLAFAIPAGVASCGVAKEWRCIEVERAKASAKAKVCKCELATKAEQEK